MGEFLTLLLANLAKVVNSVGLLFDIAGAILVFKFGLPESISREGFDFLATEGVNQEEKRKAATYDRWARLGLLALIIGFTLQFISNLV